MITGGNVQFDRHMEITLTTVQVAGTSGQVPVYKGCERQLLGQGEKQKIV
ncbi:MULTISPECIES: hypothetical protein [unclassified Sporosarcina]